MLAGLDSSYTPPSAAQADAAKAAGIVCWSGYIATKSNVGIGHAWTRGDFENARRCGGTPIAYASGWDDPVACQQLARDWGVRLCLDVESSIRGDGAWVQGWLDQSGAGLYGNAPVFAGRRAAFYICAAYPRTDPKATWPPTLPRPAGPCGWQWQGTSGAFGSTVDRSWLDDWFSPTQGDDVVLPQQFKFYLARVILYLRDGCEPSIENLTGLAAAIADDGSNLDWVFYSVVDPLGDTTFAGQTRRQTAALATQVQALTGQLAQPGGVNAGELAKIEQALADAAAALGTAPTPQPLPKLS